jgi:hypothetical protein
MKPKKRDSQVLFTRESNAMIVDENEKWQKELNRFEGNLSLSLSLSLCVKFYSVLLIGVWFGAIT